MAEVFRTFRALVLAYSGGYVLFNNRDREVFEAHSVAEVDGMASTREIARVLGVTVSAAAARLRGLQQRGLVSSAGPHHDDTLSWLLTDRGLARANAFRDFPVSPFDVHELTEPKQEKEPENG